MCAKLLVVFCFVLVVNCKGVQILNCKDLYSTEPKRIQCTHPLYQSNKILFRGLCKELVIKNHEESLKTTKMEGEM